MKYRLNLSRWLGLGLFALLLLVELPLFLRSPLWVDVELYDMAVWNIQHGGTHYRDIFETNLPGIVWCQWLIRSLFGYSSEAIRVVDFFVVAGIVSILTVLVSWAGGSWWTRFWLMMGCAHFYLLESEYIHCQRDMWMLLPAAAATYLRFRTIVRHQTTPNAPRRLADLAEGALWGAALWIKPHTLVVAIVVWGLSLLLARPTVSWRRLAVDGLWLGIGGLTVGIVGSLWLILSGTWGPMWDTLLHWNHEYYEFSRDEYIRRLNKVVMYFAPWSLIHAVAIPRCLLTLLRPQYARSDAAAAARFLLAAIYLAWMGQSTLLQKTFDYANAPNVLLAAAAMTAHRWPAMPILMAWSFLGAILTGLCNYSDRVSDELHRLQEWKPFTYQQVIPARDYFNYTRLAHWQACFGPTTDELRDGLAFYRDNGSAPHYGELREIENFLRPLNLGDGDLICWDNTTFLLYRRFNIAPGYRYMHTSTVMGFQSKLPLMRQEIVSGHAKYVVSDLMVPASFYYIDSHKNPNERLELPTDFPAEVKGVFPWDQPIVFHNQRYYVHQITRPISQNLDFEKPLHD